MAETMTPQQRYAQRHPDRLKAIRKRHRAKFRARTILSNSRGAAKRGGWTPLLCSEAFLERELQLYNGCCQCCGRKTARFKVDHDHITGAFRGLICNRCNTRLHVLEDELLMQTFRYYLGRPRLSASAS